MNGLRPFIQERRKQKAPNPTHHAQLRHLPNRQVDGTVLSSSLPPYALRMHSVYIYLDGVVAGVQLTYDAGRMHL
jgi:hypothetical protein